jgi:CRP-like cAMP-binding protein
MAGVACMPFRRRTTIFMSEISSWDGSPDGRQALAGKLRQSRGPVIPSFDQNRLLGLLAEGDLRPLVPKIEEIALEASAVLYEPNAPITHVYFPLSGIVSLIVVAEDGDDMEAATVGNEGAIGLGGLLAGDVSFSRQVVQMPGTAMRIARGPFLKAANQSPRMQRLLAAHADAFTAQLMQSAACSARHDAEQRLARWLLTVNDRSGLTRLPFTQNVIAGMLGVQRPTVTLAVRMMQSAGLIEARRGSVTILDREGLMDVSCECYAIIGRTYDTALRADSDI